MIWRNWSAVKKFPWHCSLGKNWKITDLWLSHSPTIVAHGRWISLIWKQNLMHILVLLWSRNPQTVLRGNYDNDKDWYPKAHFHTSFGASKELLPLFWLYSPLHYPKNLSQNLVIHQVSHPMQYNELKFGKQKSSCPDAHMHTYAPLWILTHAMQAHCSVCIAAWEKLRRKNGWIMFYFI